MWGWGQYVGLGGQYVGLGGAICGSGGGNMWGWGGNMWGWGGNMWGWGGAICGAGGRCGAVTLEGAWLPVAPPLPLTLWPRPQLAQAEAELRKVEEALERVRAML